MPFAQAVDAIFRSDLGEDGTFRPGFGPPVAVRVIPRRPDQITEIIGQDIQAETAFYDLQVAEVAAPKAGDHLEVGDLLDPDALLRADRYVIQGNPLRLDDRRLVWTLNCLPAGT